MHYFLIAMVVLTAMTAQDRERQFEFSQVMTVPDMEFFPGVMTGLDVLEEMKLAPLSGKTLAVLTNQTAVDRNGVHLLDILANNTEDIRVKMVFTPQYGFLAHGTESVTVVEEGQERGRGAAVKHLWGREFQPDRDDLRGVDLIVVDLQDPGIRFFSFMTTVTKVMERPPQTTFPSWCWTGQTR